MRRVMADEERLPIRQQSTKTRCPGRVLEALGGADQAALLPASSNRSCRRSWRCILSKKAVIKMNRATDHDLVLVGTRYTECLSPACHAELHPCSGHPT